MVLRNVLGQQSGHLNKTVQCAIRQIKTDQNFLQLVFLLYVILLVVGFQALGDYSYASTDFQLPVLISFFIITSLPAITV